MWKQPKFGAWCGSLTLPAPNWWHGWNNVGSKIRLNERLNRQTSLRIRRQEYDGWIDFFLGEAQSCDRHRHSLLDANAKVGLHYRSIDLDRICRMECPSPEIPMHLWQQLMKKEKQGLWNRF